MRRMVFGLVIAWSCAVLLPTAVFAQATGIAGVVKDTTGAVMPGGGTAPLTSLPGFAGSLELVGGGLLLLGGVAVARFYRRRDETAPPLSPEERQRLSAVLGEEEGSR